MSCSADIRARSRMVSAARQVGATEDDVVDESHRGNFGMVGLLDAPLNADPRHPVDHPLPQPSRTSAPTRGEADRWKAWDGFLESNAATGRLQTVQTLANF